MALEHLFDAELLYQPGMAPLAEQGEGGLVGSGDGTINGRALTGTLHWTLFEQPGELVCTMSPRLRIDTDDGSGIRVDGRGFAAREGTEAGEWRRGDAPLPHGRRSLRLAQRRARALGGRVRRGAASSPLPRLPPATRRQGGRITTRTPTDTLATAGIPPDRWGRQRLRPLSGGERAFYRWILTSFAAGSPPGPLELTDAASELDLEVEPVLQRLAREDLVHHDLATGAILVAYPFSGRPTPHRARFDGREVYAMCAIDALGMAPMLQRPIEVVSSDPVDRQTIRVTLSPEGTASWTPPESVVVSGRASEGAAFQGCCQVLNFFASPEYARWEHGHAERSGSPGSVNAR